MTPAIRSHMARQHGLITYGQAAESGLRPEHVQRLISSGAWVRVRPGVYADGEPWAELDDYLGRPLLRIRAAHLIVRAPHWFSHQSGAVIHGLSLFGPRSNQVHLTRPDMRGRRSRAAIVHHGAKVFPGETTVIDGLPVLGLARTALDVTREEGFGVGLGACDHALRHGVSRADLEAASARMTGWPYSVRVRETVELADAGAMNVFESATRDLVLELGIGVPQTQFGLTDGSRTVWCDLRVGRHIFEADGKVKLVPVAERGFAEDPVAALWEAKKRQDFVMGFKLGVSRVTHVDLLSQRDAARARLSREYADTEARFGSDITDLAPYIIRPVA